MSSYRDDTVETGVLADAAPSKQYTLAQEIAVAASVVLFGLTSLTAESAVLTNTVHDQFFTLVSEQGALSDSISKNTNRAGTLVVETRAITDTAIDLTRALITNTATLSDVVLDSLGGITKESATISDAVLATRKTTSLVMDVAALNDEAIARAGTLVSETRQLSERWIQISRSLSVVAETSAISDLLVGAVKNAVSVIETARISSSVVASALHAKNLVVEIAVVSDEVIQQPAGQAWTANTDTWAMSRYAPYSFSALAVINGKAYGTAPDGVYALSGGDDSISGKVAFANTDMNFNEGLLTHPHSAYMEYRKKNGTANMTVTTTQSGDAESYTYPLQDKQASDITASRFIFGRGLRGRRFGFVLNINAEQAEVSDLRVTCARTKRRV